MAMRALVGKLKAPGPAALRRALSSESSPLQDNILSTKAPKAIASPWENITKEARLIAEMEAEETRRTQQKIYTSELKYRKSLVLGVISSYGIGMFILSCLGDLAKN